MSLTDETVAALRAAVGADSVVTSTLERSAYARDLWPLGHIEFATRGIDPQSTRFRPPEAVVRPRTTEQVAAVLRLANERGFAVVPWGAGSGVCGGTVAVRGGVALDLKGLDRILRIDQRSLIVEAEAGINGQHLEDALNREGLTLGHFPSSMWCSTLGGWLAARGAGQLSTRYGKIEDRVLGLEAVLPTGDVVQTLATPRSATGPDWNQLFVGSEGTLGVITRATLGARPAPDVRRFRAFDFRGVASALDAIRVMLRRGARPAAVRLYDEIDTLLVGKEGDKKHDEDEPAPLAPWWPLSKVSLSGLSRLLEELPHEAKKLGTKAVLARPELANKLTRSIPGVRCLLILSFEGDQILVDAEEKIAALACAQFEGRDRGPEPAERWWRNRYAVSFKQSEVFREGGFCDTMEVATTWDRLGDLYERVRDALSPFGLVLAHFSHAYPEGASIYFSIAAKLEDGEQASSVYQKIWDAGMKATIASGAAVSHHHGIGLLKGAALRESQGALHSRVLAKVKAALDPKNVLNPGKLGLP